MKLDHQLPPYTKINSRWIKDLNISCNTIKVLEENIGRKISDIPWSNILTDMSPKPRDIKERINKWDLIKIKSFCMAKENSTKLQTEPTVWENIFANDTSDKGLISKIYNELTRLHSRKTNNPIKKWAYLLLTALPAAALCRWSQGLWWLPGTLSLPQPVLGALGA